MRSLFFFTELNIVFSIPGVLYFLV